LKISIAAQQVTVRSDTGPTVSTDTASNTSALVISGQELDALSDNPDDLIAEAFFG
jgi:hypothetical protein